MRALLLRVCAAIACLLLASHEASAGQLARGITGGLTTYTTVAGDTWRSVSARFGVDEATLARENQLTAKKALAKDILLRVDNRHLVPAAAEPVSITINLPQRMLFYNGGTLVAAFPVAVGRPDWKTPMRAFTIVKKETDPSWEVPDSIREEARRAGKYLPAVVPPGPKNPLGKFWLGLSIPNVGIHGTNAPTSIYRAGTHGCIRVAPENIAWLFPRIELGTPGRIIYEPILLAVAGEEIFLEVHRDVYRRLPDEPREVVRALAESAGLAADIDWVSAEAVMTARDGIARVVGARKNSHAAPVFSR